MRLTSLAGFLLLSVATQVAAEPLQRVRPTDPVLKGLIEQGCKRSATFRGLIGRLESADWLVFIQRGRCPDRAAVGCLWHTIGTFEDRRYVRLTVTPEGRHPDLVIATVAHELQHAFEVISDGGVTDRASLIALVQRISNHRFYTSGTTIYETTEA